MSKRPTEKEITFNQSLWHWYPLGHVDAIWNMVEHLSGHTENKYSKEVGDVFDALQTLDDKIRADLYPMPTAARRKNKKVK